jgi:hypothetical protein
VLLPKGGAGVVIGSTAIGRIGVAEDSVFPQPESKTKRIIITIYILKRSDIEILHIDFKKKTPQFYFIFYIASLIEGKKPQHRLGRKR